MLVIMKDAQLLKQITLVIILQQVLPSSYNPKFHASKALV